MQIKSPNAIRILIPNSTESKKTTPSRKSNFIKSKKKYSDSALKHATLGIPTPQPCL